MDTITTWKELTLNSLNEMGLSIMKALPNILGALVVLLLGWLVIKLVILVLRRVLKFARIERLTELVNEKKIFGKSKITFNISSVILAFVKWILFLVFLIVAADIMNWHIVSEEIGNLLRYLPQLFSGLALFLIGIYVANFVRIALYGFFETFELRGKKAISGLVFYIIAIIVTLTALNQVGVDTTIITNNLSIILGAMLAAIAIAFGLGSREVISDLLRSFYTRKNLAIGDHIRILGVEGEIEAIDNISLVLRSSEGKIILPIKEVVENKVEVLSAAS